MPRVRRHVAIDPQDRSLAISIDGIGDPAPGELLIEVAAAGLNRADLLQRSGLYPPPEDASPILGLEVAGTVCAVGEGVTQWREGDQLCALTHGGGYADFAIAPASQCLPIPGGLNLLAAAALPEALLTVWHNIFQRAAMQPGEKVLIHGGSSGIGTLAIQMVSALGGEAYTTAGNDDKCAALENLGARRAFNYSDHDFEAACTDAGLRGKINVILDLAGADFIQKNLNLAAPEGRIVSIAFIRGSKAEVNFAPLLLKRLTLTGSTLRSQSFEQKAAMCAEIRQYIYPHLDSGSIRPVIDRIFNLSDAAAAHDYMQSGAHMGKILLQP